MKSAAFSGEWLDARLAALLPAYPDVGVCVALSGGVDSVTLLAALAKSSRCASLRAIHVHHGLHPNADVWARHCRKIASVFRVPFEVIKVKVARPRGASVEAVARDARYAALGEALQPGEVLLTAHHQDDQLETVLLQLLRGAGIAGLAAMPEVAAFAAGQLARPLLTRSRAELEEWARTHELTWVDDDSNANEQLDRNYLRRSVLPLVRARWSGAGAAVSRSARHAAEARRLLDALALADVERASVGRSLSVPRLRSLDADRRRNALRFWIAREGFTAPDTRRLDEVAGPLLDARPDSNPQVRWNDTLVERNADILAIRDGSDRSAPNLAQPVDVAWAWRESSRLELVALAGELTIEQDRHGPLDLDALPEMLAVRGRRGGESLRPRAGGRTRKLKSLLQEARVSLVDRDRLPLIYAGEKLIAVSDRWLDASVQATAGAGNRARLRFFPNSRK